MISSERLNGIRAFVQAVQAGSFSTAALQLGLSKSTVGKAIARLEARLDVRLFHRTTRSLALTDEGHAFYANCVRALAELEAAEAAVASRLVKPSGRLRISLPPLLGSRWIMPVLLQLAEQHSTLEIEAEFTPRRVDFAEDGIDLAVRIGTLDAGANLAARHLGTQKLVVCATPAYFAAYGRPQSVAALAQHVCIGLLRNAKIDPWRFRNPAGGTQLVPIHSRLRIGHMDAIAVAMYGGHGIAQLPLWLVHDAIRAGTLEAVLIDEVDAGLPIHVAWPANHAMPLRLRVAIDALVNGFTPVAPWER